MPHHCPPGAYYDEEICKCRNEEQECHLNTCPPNSYLDEEICRCRKDSYDPEAECDIRECPPGTHLDEDTCTCVDNGCDIYRCPPGSYLDVDECTCKHEDEWQADCDFTCDEDNFYQDDQTCECVCGITECVEWAVLDEETC